jgi:tRNA (cytidine/uridine-2'-O-)-methyltransferase
MLNIVLFEPEIPPNTGNIIRLCANLGAYLHLIHPLGFTLDEKNVKRAGLDYGDLARITQHQNYAAFCESMGFEKNSGRVFACSTKGTRHYSDIAFKKNDTLLFGPETRGLPPSILQQLPPENRIRIPMQPCNRSLNLSNAVAIIAYESWRQLGFEGATRP